MARQQYLNKEVRVELNLTVSDNIDLEQAIALILKRGIAQTSYSIKVDSVKAV